MNTACVFSIDDAYVMPFQVFFHSLEATSSIPAGTPIFILHTDSLGPSSIDVLRAFLAFYGRSASFLDATALIPTNLPIRDGDHVSPATYYRLFIAEILPPEIDQAVYLDADMLALGSIAPLFNMTIEGHIAAADHCSPRDAILLWGPKVGTYFQAGVLVIPLQVWRQERLVDQFLEVIATQQSRIQWWDQDVLNIALHERWQRLPVWFNVCESVRLCIPQAQIDQNGLLIHFDGHRKPWNVLNSSPFTTHWDSCYAAAFGAPFDRRIFLPSRCARLKAFVRFRLSRMMHGRI